MSISVSSLFGIQTVPHIHICHVRIKSRIVTFNRSNFGGKNVNGLWTDFWWNASGACVCGWGMGMSFMQLGKVDKSQKNKGKTLILVIKFETSCPSIRFELKFQI